MTVCQKRLFSFFSVSSYLFPCLSFFLWDAFDIYFSTFEVLELFPVTNLLYLDLKHNFKNKNKKMMYREKKKSERKSTSLCHSIYRRKYKNYFFSQKIFGAWFFPSITEHSFMRLVELWGVGLAEKLNLKIFFADKGTLTSSTWRLVSCDCMLLERSN